VTFPQRRLLAAGTTTAGWPFGGVTAPAGEFDPVDTGVPTACRPATRNPRLKDRLNM